MSTTWSAKSVAAVLSYKYFWLKRVLGGPVLKRILRRLPPRFFIRCTLHHNALGRPRLRMRRARSVVRDVPHKLLDPMVHLRRVRETRFKHECREAVPEVVL